VVETALPGWLDRTSSATPGNLALPVGKYTPYANRSLLLRDATAVLFDARAPPARHSATLTMGAEALPEGCVGQRYMVSLKGSQG
jgi:hypothetical protein